MSCSGLLQALDVRECVCEYGANVLSLVQSPRPLWERMVSAQSGVGGAGGRCGGEGGGDGGAGTVQTGRSAKELLMTLPCPSAQTVSKYNSQYHKLFACVPKDEILMKGTFMSSFHDVFITWDNMNLYYTKQIRILSVYNRSYCIILLYHLFIR